MVSAEPVLYDTAVFVPEDDVLFVQEFPEQAVFRNFLSEDVQVEAQKRLDVPQKPVDLAAAVSVEILPEELPGLPAI